MFVEQFEEKGLAQYSYAIGNRESGQIAIIDPRFDSDIYLKYAEQNGFVISHVFDTHIHADYVSGARYLAIRARAILVLSGHDKGERYEVKFPHKVCFDGDFIKIGPITLEVVHTPGHAPEHISLLAWENGTPKIFFSGDFLLVGSVGPPDFIEPDHTERQLHKLYDVIKEKLHKLSDSITIYPAHGPGFLYGMKIGDTAFSTLGQEWLTNPFLRPNISRDEFVALVLSHYVPLPIHYHRIKSHNIFGEWDKALLPSALELTLFQKELAKGCVVVDLRDAKIFCEKHIPGSICIGSGDRVGFWSSRVLSFNKPLLIVTDDPTYIEKVIRALARVGLYHILGYLKGGVETWRLSNLPVQTIVATTPHEVHEKRFTCQVVDVRSLEEWNMGHISYAQHIPCCELPNKIKNLSKGKLVFICAGSYRSTLAASYAKYFGYEDTAYIPGGISSWQRSGLPLVTD